MSNNAVSKITIVYHSGFGHTEVQANAVGDGARSVDGTEVSIIKAEDAADQLELLDQADAIVFGSPTYMGSVSAPFKGFMDASSKAWFTQNWKNKIAAGFTNSSSQSGDKLNTLMQMSIFAAQHGMIWVGLDLPPGNNSSTGSPEDLNRIGSYIGAMAQSNSDAPPDLAPPPADLATARHLGVRVAEATKRWNGLI